jgi:hypothetical protein
MLTELYEIDFEPSSLFPILNKYSEIQNNEKERV